MSPHTSFKVSSSETTATVLWVQFILFPDSYSCRLLFKVANDKSFSLLPVYIYFFFFLGLTLFKLFTDALSEKQTGLAVT